MLVTFRGQRVKYRAHLGDDWERVGLCFLTCWLIVRTGSCEVYSYRFLTFSVMFMNLQEVAIRLSRPEW